MSTLTKILVVLLSLFSIFLCGMMVAFVGNAKNFKKLYDDQKGIAQYTQAELAKQDSVFNTERSKFREQEARLQEGLATLESQRNQLLADLRNSQRLSAQYQSQADSWKGVMTGFEQSVRALQASLQQTQQQLDNAREQGIRDQKELNQITAELYTKIVELQSMEAERRRLLEQKTELEKQISAVSVDLTPREARPVTPLVRTAEPAAPTIAAAAVRGVVLDVDGSLVHLSVGAADGVRENMVLHVTRGDRFLCDVVVTHVDTDQSAGILQLVQSRPQPGDTASTQL